MSRRPKPRRLPGSKSNKREVLVAWASVIETEWSAAHAAATPPKSCWICHERIWVKGKNHPLAHSWDHVVPRSLGGDGELLRPAHRYCNCRRGNEEVTIELVEICRAWVLDQRRKPQHRGKVEAWGEMGC